MKFFTGFSGFTFSIRLIKHLLATAFNILIISYASKRALENGDTDLISGGILLLCMLGNVALLIDGIRVSRKAFVWSNVLYLLFCLFNTIYFFSILSCCVPIAGDMI